MDVNVRGDKRELGIKKRRKDFHTQEALVLLAQLGHNALVWFKRWFLGGTAAAKLEVERSVKDVMTMPTEVRVERRGAKVRLKLLPLHPWAKAVAKSVRARFPRSG